MRLAGFALGFGGGALATVGVLELLGLDWSWGYVLAGLGMVVAGTAMRVWIDT